jgi:DNA-binding MarR family transcriptional regulator
VSNPLTTEEQILVALRRIIRAVDLHSRQLVDRAGLTGPQLVLLRAAARLRKPTAGELARDIHLSQATVTGILDRLEKRSLIERVRNGHDRRSIFVQITPQGEAQLKSAPSGLQEQFLQELGELESWEQTSILATLQRIVSMMEAEHVDASPVLVTGPVTCTCPEVQASPPPLAAVVEILPEQTNGLPVPRC